ncbi:hypothetical protein ACHQM5_024981 [Ranunculus cassubicifolius]
MPPSRHSAPRIDTAELKAQIISKIGNEKAAKYFRYFNRLVSVNLSKSEFSKLCIGIIGRENLALHNRFVESILKNACNANSPPVRGSKVEEGVLNGKGSNGYHRSNLQLLYGDAFPLSPRKGRSSNLRDHRRLRDRPSPLGPNGNAHSAMHEYDEIVPKKTDLVSLSSRPRLEVVSVEDGEEVEQERGSPSVQSRVSVSAPLGIKLNTGGTRNTFHTESICNRDELPDTFSLRKQLEKKVKSEELGVSMDCVNALNSGLDAFLKRMIKPCLNLAKSRKGSECVSASLLDFRVAMNLNPQLLGEHWPIQLERVCFNSSEE